MVTIDLDSCTGCGVCMTRFAGYCIVSDNGKPKIDDSVCNECQKCIAICPRQAILMNGKPPVRIKEPCRIRSGDLKELYERRRSIKKFKKDGIARDILQDIAIVASYAPSQNKNIEIIIIDDNAQIDAIDCLAMKYVGRYYRLLFSVRILTKFFLMFSNSLGTVQRKMERDLLHEKHIVKENTQCLFVLVGDARTPVTESSAQYSVGNADLCRVPWHRELPDGLPQAGNQRHEGSEATAGNSEGTQGPRCAGGRVFERTYRQHSAGV